MWKRHPRILRLWQRVEAWSICVDGTVSWFCSDDTHERRRKLDWEISVPSLVWRPYCWLYGHAPQGEPRHDYCVICRKVLRRGR